MKFKYTCFFVIITMSYGLVLRFSPNSQAQIPPSLVAISGEIILDTGIDIARELVCEHKSIPVFCLKGKTSKNTPIKVAKETFSFVARNFDLIHSGASKLYQATLPQPTLLEKGIELGLSKDFLLSTGPNAIVIIAMHQALAQTKKEIMESIREESIKLFSAQQESFDALIARVDNYNLRDRFEKINELQTEIRLAKQRYIDLPINPSQDQVHYISNKILDAIKSSRILYNHAQELELWELYFGIRLSYGLASSEQILDQINQVMMTPSYMEFAQNIDLQYCNKYASTKKCVTNSSWEAEQFQVLIENSPIKKYLNEQDQKHFKKQWLRLNELRDKIATLTLKEVQPKGSEYLSGKIALPLTIEERTQEYFKNAHQVIWERKSETYSYALDLDIKAVNTEAQKKKVSFSMSNLPKQALFINEHDNLSYSQFDLSKGIKMRGRDYIDDDPILVDYAIKGVLKLNSGQLPTNLRVNMTAPGKIYGEYKTECMGFNFSEQALNISQTLTCGTEQFVFELTYVLRSTSK